MTSTTVRDRLVAAAFELFEEQGFEQTTTEQIAARAGVGRTTFFRNAGSKDDVVFPDHDRILAAVAARLSERREDSAVAAAIDASRIVMRHYVEEGQLARSRYRLTSEVPALRAREVASISRYQRLFYEHFRVADPPLADDDGLTAELMAAAWVTAHNRVLRRWLRGRTDAPEDEMVAVLHDVLARLVRSTDKDDGDTAVLVFRTTQPPAAVLAALQAVVSGERDSR